MTTPCKNCGKSKANTHAGSVTSYFFQHNYCQCDRKQSQPAKKRNSAPDSESSTVCSSCGKARPTDRRLGSFTSFLFKELRCQCSGFSASTKVGRRKHTRTAFRAAQKKQFTSRFKIDSQAEEGSVLQYFQPGTVIGGTFKISSIIGEGGMGVVYKVQHVGLNRPFALKVLTPNLVNEQSWLRFQAEARTLSALHHASLVNVYDLGIHEKTVPFYSMDCLSGQNLEEILCQNGPLPLDQTLDIFLLMLDGLAYAHRNGVIHRDIKPGNIFICSDENTEIKILDFGISKLIGSSINSQHLTNVGEVFGSPFYMSPEQCRGEAVDVRTDIYSVGCTLFEALTGFVPFEGETNLETSLMHEEDPPPALADVLPDHSLPESLDIVLAKCLAKLPSHRYQSAKELAIDLVRVKDGKAIQDYARSTDLSRGGSGEELSERAVQKKNLLVLVQALVFLIISSLALVQMWRLFSVHKSEVKSVQPQVNYQEATMKSLAHDPNDPTDTNLTKENIPNSVAIENFLKEQQKPYSSDTVINKKKYKKFEFPSSFSLGRLYQNEGNYGPYIEAQSVKIIPADRGLYLVCIDTDSAYPTLLKYFQKNDLTGLEVRKTPYKITDSIIANIAHLSGLQCLELPNIVFKDGDAENLDKLTSLSSLVIKSNASNTAELAKSRMLLQLVTFRMYSAEDVIPLLKTLAASKKLTSLSLPYANLDHDEIALIASMKQLERLSLSSSSVSNKDIETLTKLKNLTFLNLQECNKLDEGCRVSLNKFKNLQRPVPTMRSHDLHLNELKQFY